MRFVLDAGYLIALAIENDQHHPDALENWERVLQANSRVVTTTFVLSEAVTFINRRGTHEAAVRISTSVRESQAIELLQVDSELFEQGWRQFVGYQDKLFSLTDCISFVVMQERGIREALSFDHHFQQAGFTLFGGLG